MKYHNPKKISITQKINCLLSIVFVVACTKPSPKQTQQTPFGYLAFGDIRGEVEPCGCDPETDLGGIRRIAKVINQEASMSEVYSLGNNYPSKAHEHKINLINKTLAKLPLSAALFNELEFEQYKNKNLDLTNIPYVLSNMSPILDKKIAFSRDTQNTIILGYVTPSRHSQLKPAEKVLQLWRNFLKNNEKKKVLLFSGDNSELNAISKTEIFDEIITSNPKSMNSTPDHLEKQKPGVLLRNDKWYMVPSFGQGVLLGGALRNAPKITLPLFQNQSPTKNESALAPNRLFVWLDKSLQDNKLFAEEFARYQKDVAEDFNAVAKLKISALKASPFAGAEACKNCHVSAFQAWEKSAHAHALATLKAKTKHQDPECVSCHVLGFKDKGGFVDEKSSPHFANVQCETCHGPRKEHVANPAVKPKLKTAAKAVCVDCHHQPHSSNFKFETYWPKIKHGK